MFSKNTFLWIIAFLVIFPLMSLRSQAISRANSSSSASELCLKVGGSLRMGGAAAERLRCKLPSGQVCEVRALLRNACDRPLAQVEARSVLPLTP